MYDDLECQKKECAPYNYYLVGVLV
jgi:hypothetical protein